MEKSDWWLETELLLMEETLHHLIPMKPYEKWDILHVNWLAGFLPSTVWVGLQKVGALLLGKVV